MIPPLCIPFGLATCTLIELWSYFNGRRVVQGPDPRGFPLPGPPLTVDSGLQSQPGDREPLCAHLRGSRNWHTVAVTHTSKGTTVNARETHGDVVTSYKNAQTRTVTADGVTFAYRDLGPRTGMPVIFITHLAAVLDTRHPLDEAGGHQPVAQPARGRRRGGQRLGESAEVDAVMVLEDVQHPQLGRRGRRGRGPAPHELQQLDGRRGHARHLIGGGAAEGSHGHTLAGTGVPVSVLGAGPAPGGPPRPTQLVHMAGLPSEVPRPPTKDGVLLIVNRFEAAERALRTAAPHELLDAVRAVLVERYGARSVELFMACLLYTSDAADE